MESLLGEIIELLIRLGPWIVLLVVATETAFFIGLLVPAEATVLVAGFLAYSGRLDLGEVLLATVAGAVLGDNTGYLLGRFGGRRAAASEGRIGRTWRRYEARAALLFRRRSILSVSLARFISFVRTLMPWFAGMSHMPWPRFFFFDLIGVLGWGIGSVMAGYLAGESWHRLAGAFGTVSTIIVLLLVGLVVFFVMRSRRRLKRLRRIALTGNIASGKSTVSDRWRELGAVVIDADELARRAVEPGTSTLAAVVKRFGNDVLAGDGTLDRARLRERVFDDAAERRALEAILHPEIERLRREEEAAAAAAGVEVVVHSIPLLFETGMHELFDRIVLVDAPAAARERRLVETRGLDAAAARAMMTAQKPAAEKRDAVTWIIDNDAGLDELIRRADEVWAQINRNGT